MGHRSRAVVWALPAGGAGQDPHVERTYTLRMSTGAFSGDCSHPPRPRTGLFGGTFDPPHNGHLATAAIVRHALGLDEVWLVVAHRPWQKEGTRAISPPAVRLALTGAAVAGVAGLRASAVEIERGGDSYTADTLADLRRDDPDRELLVVVGADAAGGLPTWERAEEVRAGATVVLVDRPGVPATPLPPTWTFVRVEIPRLDISSTDLRRRVREGEPIDGLVPAAVRAMIDADGLYRGGAR
jgi:nicotinate-nucleotide adenylyltransferase